MHLGMNMLSTFAISSLLEKKLGTLRFLFSVVSAMIFSGILYCTISWSAYKILGYEDFMYEHAVGFSGVIFHMSVLECSLSPNVSRNIFGFFSIPPFLYPWALLILLQMFLPNLSFLGHLSGIITGTLQSYGLFEFVIPGESYTSQMESLEVLRRLVNLPSFVSTPNSSRFLYQRETGGIFKFIKRGCAFMIKLFKDVWETLFVCIFGRGSSLNSNIQIFGRGTMHADGPGKISYPTDIIEEASDDERDPLSILV
jgi:rhomboid domain-containing protein 1